MIYSPVEIAKNTIKVGVTKARRKFKSTFILALIAGGYIALAGIASTIISHDVASYLGFGLMKMISGLIFSVALILIVIAGAELFTGNCLMIMAVWKKRIKATAMLNNWIIVYTANFIGAVTVAFLMVQSGLWQMNSSLTGATALKIANAKVNITFSQALIRGIFANWLVCLGVWLAYAAKDVIGKIAGCMVAIVPFVASGFEHSIANMYYIPTGIFLKSNELICDAANLATADLSNLTWQRMLTANLLPVTLGNIIGGAFLVGTLYFMVYGDKS